MDFIENLVHNHTKPLLCGPQQPQIAPIRGEEQWHQAPVNYIRETGPLNVMRPRWMQFYSPCLPKDEYCQKCSCCFL